ncbi:MAG: hypothetical protein HC821_01675 [Lewinella sp.]|nr:hypothetical protein [Lewinella sp.]
MLKVLTALSVFFFFGSALMAQANFSSVVSNAGAYSVSADEQLELHWTLGEPPSVI